MENTRKLGIWSVRGQGSVPQGLLICDGTETPSLWSQAARGGLSWRSPTSTSTGLGDCCPRQTE